MMYNSIAYIIYLSFCLITILWVGKILHRNGKHFLFGECADEAMSEAANNLLYVGYCLINIGFAFYFLNTCETLTNYVQVFEFIVSSEGSILITLSVMHFLNMILAPKIITFFIKKRGFFGQGPNNNNINN